MLPTATEAHRHSDCVSMHAGSQPPLENLEDITRELHELVKEYLASLASY